MSKRELTVYIYLTVLAVAFISVSAAIILLGNKPQLVRAKLKVGATIIALNAMLAGCDHIGGGWASCYDVSWPDTDTTTDTDTDTDTDTETYIIECYDTTSYIDTETDTGTETATDTDTNLVTCYEIAPIDTDSDTGSGQ